MLVYSTAWGGKIAFAPFLNEGSPQLIGAGRVINT